MALILCIETATSVCSVSLSENGKLLAEKKDNEGQNHAKLLTVLIDELFQETTHSSSQLDAVAISQGPGSYTGLRIGTSVAKGICYALDIPLIAVNTLQAMANNTELPPNALRCPMIDARRMEVYCQIFTPKLSPLSEVTAKILNTTSFNERTENQEIAFFGDGAEKFESISQSENALFPKNILPLASQMIALAEKAYSQKNFENVAYFTPFYLKKYQVTTSKKRVF